MRRGIEIIWDYDRAGKLAFRAKIDGRDYEDIRQVNTAASLKTVADTTATARRFGGFTYYSDRKVFGSTVHTKPTDPARLIETFRREGYAVTVRGAYADGKCLPDPQAGKWEPDEGKEWQKPAPPKEKDRDGQRDREAIRARQQRERQASRGSSAVLVAAMTMG